MVFASDFSVLVLSRMFIINCFISFGYEGTVSYFLGAYPYCGIDFYLSERVAFIGFVCGVVVFGTVSHRRSFACDTTVVHVEQAPGGSTEEITRVSLLGGHMLLFRRNNGFCETTNASVGVKRQYFFV